MARLLETAHDWRTWSVAVSTNTAEITTDINYLYMGIYNKDIENDVFIRHTNTQLVTDGMVIPIGSFKDIPVRKSGHKYVKTETGTADIRVEIGLL